jgi:hypothetical protein
MSFDNRLKISRRHLLKGGAFGLSGLLLRSLAIGLPPAALMGPRTSFGQAGRGALQTLILSTSSAGDPVNVNCPGSYVSGVENNPLLNAVDFMLGDTPTRACEAWANLPPALHQRLAFVHYRTNSAAHPEYASTMAFRGSVKNAVGNGSEMFPSAVARMGATGIGSLQSEPIPLGKETITVEGNPLQNLKPSEIKELFSGEEQTFADLRTLRDQALDGLYADLKTSGTRSQRAFLDQYALSRTQARALGDSLGGLLEALPADPDPEAIDGALDQVIAAVALARLKVTPVVTVNIPFGMDNHQDGTLEIEAEQTTRAGTVLTRLWQELEAAQLSDSVSFGMLNVFGRTLQRNGSGGRNHNRLHAVMVAFGAQINPGVYGGIGADGGCLPINPTTGLGELNGAIATDDTMVSAGKSLLAALGHDRDAIETRVQGGNIIEGLLKSR